MIILPIKNSSNNFESDLENNIDEAVTFFRNKGIKYVSALKNGLRTEEFRDALRNYIKLKLGENKCEEVIKKIPRLIMKYDAFFENGKSAYKGF